MVGTARVLLSSAFDPFTPYPAVYFRSCVSVADAAVEFHFVHMWVSNANTYTPPKTKGGRVAQKLGT